MGKKRKSSKVAIEECVAAKKVQLDNQSITDTSQGGDSNMLIVMPKKKENTPAPVKTTKKLSKKERKRLTDIIARKDKKEKRAQLLESLAKHQATEEEMKNFTSITEVYSQNFKGDLSVDDTFEMKANTIKGSKKKKIGPKFQTQAEPESTDTDDISTDEEVEAIIEEVQQKKEETKAPVDLNPNLVEEQTQEKIEPDAATNAEVSPPPQICKPATFIPVDRKPEIQEARLKLPILAEEQVVMETINENSVAIICGETGSGKTTQVPQFLYEAGYAHGEGIIGVTEPRRVAAISMSKRVATEMNVGTDVVSYQIRFEGNTTPDTKIKFLTDGVLLKEAQQDPLLSKYSVIIIDEAHERSVYTDILIGLLSIIVRQRQKRGRPMKLLIMSATLRVEDFTGQSLFKSSTPPPVIKVEARQFPVTVHFNKKTEEDYVTEAYKKVCKLHRTLPEGGILVFVTGQQEVHTLSRKLKRMFPYIEGQATVEENKKESRRERKRKKAKEQEETSALPTVPKIDLSRLKEKIEKGARKRIRMGENKPDSSHPLYVLPLYSLLPSDKQARVFDPAPDGCRLCIIATNVAETSLTIPNIKYVVDTGKTKTKFYDKVTGVSTFRVTWVSQASADQRAGRAGRLGPGHCYRLYSSAVFSDFSQFSPPEITRRPVDDLVLQMKSMRIDKVANFPFPTPPETEQIKPPFLYALQHLFKANVAFKDSRLVVDPKLPPPSEAQILGLRKIVLGGLADHVARINPAPPPGLEKSEAKRLRGSFQCLQLEDLVYIHPESSLYKDTEGVEFVVYQSMVETSRLYMRGLCCVEAHWFPEMAPSYCILSKPLEEPSPYFDASSGKVMCHRTGSFGRCNWEIPAVEMEYPDSVDCFRWFARFLLQGDVFPRLQKFKSSLVLAPATMVKSWAKLQPKTETFLNVLLSRGTNTKTSLAAIWKQEPSCILRPGKAIFYLLQGEYTNLEFQEAWKKVKSWNFISCPGKPDEGLEN
ncbi:pre-mRNA-splicing factor ATP-dependent RNA helicase prp16 [Plakobranchus ocellatus]|uniref:RNA helicase n=1 Tax=Plakobranchus ocellatus TaxID=259542 RepID=A0AAV4CSD4_9GAST|nr:pre-mRNA-splicing factor ATP-dependent RNA helicase prp16 [Plakobranchus ocellatus]